MPWRRRPNLRLRYCTTGRPAGMKAEGLSTLPIYCVGPPVRDPPPPLLALFRDARWMDSPIETGTIFVPI